MQATPNQPRPLPDLPTDEASFAGPGAATMDSSSSGGGHSSGMHRWTSRENLLTAATDEDPHLFVALYDFQVSENIIFLRLVSFLRYCRLYFCATFLWYFRPVVPLGDLLFVLDSVLVIIRNVSWHLSDRGEVSSRKGEHFPFWPKKCTQK